MFLSLVVIMGFLPDVGAGDGPRRPTLAVGTATAVVLAMSAWRMRRRLQHHGIECEPKALFVARQGVRVAMLAGLSRLLAGHKGLVLLGAVFLDVCNRSR
jgi:ABC-type xylose transport system permease subunit